MQVAGFAPSRSTCPSSCIHLITGRHAVHGIVPVKACSSCMQSFQCNCHCCLVPSSEALFITPCPCMARWHWRPCLPPHMLVMASPYHHTAHVHAFLWPVHMCRAYCMCLQEGCYFVIILACWHFSNACRPVAAVTQDVFSHVVSCVMLRLTRHHADS